jgi:hypothetical protein
MKPEIKQKWIDALRSGKYKQGRGYLRTSRDEYCCLGVLCDLYSKENPSIQWEPFSDNTELYSFNGLVAVPPYCVNDWCDQEELNIDITQEECMHDPRDTVALAGINDMQSSNFNMIADLIEKYF